MIRTKKMQAQFIELSLDEPYKRILERFGVNFELYEDGAVKITSVHADLSDDLYERDIDASELEGAIITSINGVVVDTLSDEAFESLHDGESIEIIVEDSEQKFVLKKIHLLSQCNTSQSLVLILCIPYDFLCH